MNINRVIKKQQNFTQIENQTLRDKNLSMEARGLLAFMLSHSEKFNHTRESLMAEFKVSRKKIIKVLGELKTNKYLRVQAKRNGRLFTGQEWSLFETPELTDPMEVPAMEVPTMETTIAVTTSQKNNLSEEQKKEEEEAPTASNFEKEPKQNFTPNKQEKIQNGENLLNADSPNKNHSKPAENGINKDLTNNKINSGFDVNSVLSEKEVPASILIYKELCENKKLSTKEFEEIIQTVTPGTEQLWRETILAYQIEALKRNWQAINLPVYLERFLNKKVLNRNSALIQATGAAVHPVTRREHK